MNIMKLIYQIKQPCPKCPYKLGTVKTLVNPCPQCKLNGYQSFKKFQKHNISSNTTDANISKMISIEGLTPCQIYANIYNASSIEENILAFRQMIALTSKEMEINPTFFEDMKAQGKDFFHNLFLRLFGY